uniref:Uncharacterized protein n=1 Tax=Panagrellus redivivus TaxID=6233 RepID=A0A7E4VV74_PANRE
MLREKARDDFVTTASSHTLWRGGGDDDRRCRQAQRRRHPRIGRPMDGYPQGRLHSSQCQHYRLGMLFVNSSVISDALAVSYGGDGLPCESGREMSYV